MTSNILFIVASNISRVWSTDCPYQTAYVLSKRHIVICWILQPITLKEYLQQKFNPPLLTKQTETLYFYQTLYILPFCRFSFIRFLNIQLSVTILRIISWYIVFTKQIHKTIIWVFDPQYTSLYKQIVKFKKNIHLIYDCTDCFQGLPVDIKHKNQIKNDEEYLLRKANIVTSITHALKRVHQNTRSDIRVVPQGFRYEAFKRISKTIPIHLPNDKPIIGYIGGVNYRLDFYLLHQLIKKNPQYYFVFVGEVRVSEVPILRKKVQQQIQQLFTFKNVLHYPNLPKSFIPGVIKQFDIGMIPYDIAIDFNKYCYPMKLFEYFYMGKPVISTSIEELFRFPKYVKIGMNVIEWENHIRNLLFDPWSKEYQIEQKKLAIVNSWDKKIQTILLLLN